MTVRDMNILIIGGGTGGHISPGIALYEEFREQGVRAYFLSGNRDRRFSISDDVDGKDLLYYGAPAFTKNIFKIPYFIIMFLSAMYRAWRIIRKNRITAVIGMGGYVSAPALASAALMKTPLFLCEQNSIPGKVTSLFEKFSKRVYGTFEASRNYMKNGEKFIHGGNPLRKRIFADVAVNEARKAFNLNHCRYIVLVLGGSQGAAQINNLIIGLKRDYNEDFKEIGFIWSTGESTYELFKKQVHENIDEGSIYISPYIKKIGLAYRASNLAISRSGAGVMMELAAMGIPSILIPYPYSADGHQDMNADIFAREGASYKVGNSEALPARVAPMILKMIGNQRVINNMSEKALALAKNNSTEIIAKDIIERLGGKGGTLGTGITDKSEGRN